MFVMSVKSLTTFRGGCGDLLTSSRMFSISGASSHSAPVFDGRPEGRCDFCLVLQNKEPSEAHSIWKFSHEAGRDT